MGGKQYWLFYASFGDDSKDHHPITSKKPDKDSQEYSLAVVVKVSSKKKWLPLGHVFPAISLRAAF